MKIIYVVTSIFLLILLSGCGKQALVEKADNGSKIAEKLTVEENKRVPELSKTEEIDRQIKRIEEKLSVEPTVKGWTIIGDAHMHLKRYEKAMLAYREAYILSNFDADARRKLKSALYYVTRDSVMKESAK